MSEGPRSGGRPPDRAPAVLEVPEPALVVLVGASGSGKSTFARRHFLPTEVVSSDACRALVADSEEEQGATDAAFRLLRAIVEERLRAGRLAVVDATNVQPLARRPLLRLAERYDCAAVAVAFDLPEAVLNEWNGRRPGRHVVASVLRRQHRDLRRALERLPGEGFAAVHVLASAAEVEEAVVERRRPAVNARQRTGPPRPPRAPGPCAAGAPRATLGRPMVREFDTSHVEVAHQAGAELGEGPIWDHRHQQLVWVDITGSRVHRLDPSSGRGSVRAVGRHVGAAVLRRSGGLALAVQEGFVGLPDAGGALETLAEVEARDPGTRFNDGAVDSLGRFWAGTMAYDRTPGAGSLYRLDPDHGVTRVLTGVTISNGICWSLDDRLMYYIDTPTKRVDVFDFERESGALTNRRQLARVGEGRAGPDGMVLDEEGFLWVAVFNGGALHRYTPGGELERVLRLPVSQVTKCAFGGRDLSDLYITSAQEHFGDEDRAREPLAGSVFVHRPGVRGLAAGLYGG